MTWDPIIKKVTRFLFYYICSFSSQMAMHWAIGGGSKGRVPSLDDDDVMKTPTSHVG